MRGKTLVVHTSTMGVIYFTWESDKSWKMEGNKRA